MYLIGHDLLKELYLIHLDRMKIEKSDNLYNPKLEEHKVGGLYFNISYGSKNYYTPFSIKLRDFQLERYPGSMSPSSFAAEVTVKDGRVNEDHRIFMNTVLDYRI